jgi:hypothetical protein
MSIFANDDMAILVDRLFTPATSTWYERREVYNPETHELVPRKSYLERELKAKEQQMANLKKEIEDIKKRL